MVQRIGLFGLFGVGNIGNDGSMESMLRFLRATRPDADLTCICGGPALIEKRYGVRSVGIGGDRTDQGVRGLLNRLPLVRKLLQGVDAFREARRFDVIIVPGTGILDDFGDSFLGMPVSLLTWCAAARLCGAKLAFVSVGAGPIRHPVSRWLMQRAAGLAHYRSYRDTVSKAFMDSIGFDTGGDPIFPDIAFRLQAPEGVGERAPGRSEPLTVGVGVMAYYGWRGPAGPGANEIYAAYLDKMARFVLWLLDRGHPVRILTGETTDQQAVDDLLRVMAQRRPDFACDRIVAEPVHSLHDLMSQIAMTDIVVATRFHNIVCALKLCKPAASISYARKNDVLMAEMGLGEYCHHVELLDVDRLIDDLTRLIAARETHVRTMQEVNALYRERLDRQEQALLEMLRL